MKILSVIIKTIFLFSLTLFLVTLFYNNQLIELDGGTNEVSSIEPIQKEIDSNYSVSFETDDFSYELKPLYDYEISGVIVAKKDYGFMNDEADGAVQFDLCIVWGDNLVDNLYLKDEPDYTRLNRACYHNRNSVQGFNEQQFSGNHLIINTPELLDEVKRLNIGDEVRISGKLVNLTAFTKDNMIDPVLDWETSVDRLDVGKDSGELIYLDSIEMINYAHYREAIINYYAMWVAIISFGLLVLRFIGILIFMVPKKTNES